MSAASHMQTPTANEASMAARALRLISTRTTKASRTASMTGYDAHTVRTNGATLWSPMIASIEVFQKIATLTTTMVNASITKSTSTRPPLRPWL